MCLICATDVVLYLRRRNNFSSQKKGKILVGILVSSDHKILEQWKHIEEFSYHELYPS